VSRILSSISFIQTNKSSDHQELFPQSLVSSILLFYNSIEQVVGIFSKLNKQWRSSSINHLHYRLSLMNEETERYEDAFEEVVHSINRKRLNYYREFDIEPPSKEKALFLLHKLSPSDILYLRKVKKIT
jgi:hypothetical protein